MSKKLLRQYIETVVAESPLARVPTQLLPPEDSSGRGKSKKRKDKEGDEVKEFSGSGAGAVAGYTLPLGMSPDAAGRRKNRPKRKK